MSRCLGVWVSGFVFKVEKPIKFRKSVLGFLAFQLLSLKGCLLGVLIGVLIYRLLITRRKMGPKLGNKKTGAQPHLLDVC